MLRVKLQDIIRAIMLLLALFLIYHIILKLLGGSLGKEELLLSFLAIALTISINASAGLARLDGKFEQFEKSFRAMATDCKAMHTGFILMQADMKVIQTDMKTMKAELKAILDK